MTDKEILEFVKNDNNEILLCLIQECFEKKSYKVSTKIENSQTKKFTFTF